MIPKVHIGKVLPATQVWTCRVLQRRSGCQGTTRPRPTVKTSLRSKQIHSPELMQKARRKAYFTGLEKYSIFYLDSHSGHKVYPYHSAKALNPLLLCNCKIVKPVPEQGIQLRHILQRRQCSSSSHLFTVSD